MLPCCWFSALYANIRHDPRSEYNRWKSERSKCQWNGDFRWWSFLRKFLGPKEHLDWLQIDLNVAEVITVED